jgi:uncharacterized protein
LIYLLDVNVLIALIDPQHADHDEAHRWFEQKGDAAWATCPVVENGAIRIAGDPRYPGSPATPAVVAESVRTMRSLPGYVFWADDVSLLDFALFQGNALRSKDVTDVYLLCLAKSRGGKLATFDRRIRAEAVAEGRDHLLQLSDPPIT